MLGGQFIRCLAKRAKIVNALFVARGFWNLQAKLKTRRSLVCQCSQLPRRRIPVKGGLQFKEGKMRGVKSEPALGRQVFGIERANPVRPRIAGRTN